MFDSFSVLYQTIAMKIDGIFIKKKISVLWYINRLNEAFHRPYIRFAKHPLSPTNLDHYNKVNKFKCFKDASCEISYKITVSKSVI